LTWSQPHRTHSFDAPNRNDYHYGHAADLASPGRCCALVRLLAAACSSGVAAGASASSGHAIVAVGAENEIRQRHPAGWWKYVTTSAVMSNPNTDPHTFEASTSVARESAQPSCRAERRRLRHVHEYDRAGPCPTRAARYRRAELLGCGQHAEPAPVVQAVHDAGRGQRRRRGPGFAAAPHASYFRPCAYLHRSLARVGPGVAAFKAKYRNTPVAVTEPVADTCCRLRGRHQDPFAFQADIMNGVDPSPRTSRWNGACSPSNKVKVFLSTSRDR